MISLEINDVKHFMNLLLLKETFDAFHLTEATITTFGTFTLDGHLQKDYFIPEEYEALLVRQYPLARWKQFRPYCLDLIKGKKTPLSFQFIFQLPSGQVEKLLADCGHPCTLADINGLFLNIRYDGSHLHAVTGTSMRLFTLDKTLENAWDSMVSKFILSLES